MVDELEGSARLHPLGTGTGVTYTYHQPGFYMDAEDPDSNPHACPAGTLVHHLPAPNLFSA